jgi:hypothetical protein
MTEDTVARRLYTFSPRMARITTALRMVGHVAGAGVREYLESRRDGMS